MPKKRKWTIDQLRQTVKESVSVRQVISKIGLVPAGGNYQQVLATIEEENISIKHFTGKGWRKNKTFAFKPQIALPDILKKDSTFQSFKLKSDCFGKV